MSKIYYVMTDRNNGYRIVFNIKTGKVVKSLTTCDARNPLSDFERRRFEDGLTTSPMGFFNYSVERL